MAKEAKVGKGNSSFPDAGGVFTGEARLEGALMRYHKAEDRFTMVATLEEEDHCMQIEDVGNREDESRVKECSPGRQVASKPWR